MGKKLIVKNFINHKNTSQTALQKHSNVWAIPQTMVKWTCLFCQLRDADACQNMSVTRKPHRNDILY
jgi:hypothetical protein